MSDSESEYSDYETDITVYTRGSRLPFDPISIEKIILSITDKFDFRVVLNNKKVKTAMLVTTGLSIAGAVIGKHYGGNRGAFIGGAVGGVCGIGVMVVTMREVWEEIKGKLPELYHVVYDYLAGLGIEDYRKALEFVMQSNGITVELAKLVLQITSETLGKQILSNLTDM